METTRKELEGTRRDLVDVKDTLTQQIARNRDELQQLRLKGERNFYEFELDKKKKVALVGDVRILLLDANAKKKSYGVRIVVDDNQLEKKNRTVNEPVQFLVGRTKLRYELVVNDVQKDKIAGYLSTPKDKGYPPKDYSDNDDCRLLLFSQQSAAVPSCSNHSSRATISSSGHYICLHPYRRVAITKTASTSNHKRQ